MISMYYNSFHNLEFSKMWTQKMSVCMEKLKKTRTGSILIKKINELCKSVNNNVTIVSKQKYFTNVRYPKITYYNGKSDINVIIPETEYKALVTVIDYEILPKYLIEDQNIVIKYLAGISNNIDVTKDTIVSTDIKTKNENYNDILKIFTYQQFQPLELILAHELVHSLRLLLDSNLDSNLDDLEEQATIFGVTNYTLNINGVRITENSIRKDLGYPMRVNHEANVSF